MSTSSMHVAKTGLNAQQTRMQIIANNLANVNTTGFKRDRANFETLLYQVRRTAGDQVTGEANLTSSFSVGTGARIVNTQKAHTQGSLITTDNALDLSIEGGGFFQVLLPDNRIGYTRNGAFSVNADGVLTTASGYVVQPEIAIPDGAAQINVSRDGVIAVTVAGAVGAEAVGQLQVADAAGRLLATASGRTPPLRPPRTSSTPAMHGRPHREPGASPRAEMAAERRHFGSQSESPTS